MKKRIWGLILAVMLAASLCAVTAFADGDVAEVNGQGYPSLRCGARGCGERGDGKAAPGRHGQHCVTYHCDRGQGHNH